MPTPTATVKNGQLVLEGPLDAPEGTRFELVPVNEPAVSESFERKPGTGKNVIGALSPDFDEPSERAPTRAEVEDALSVFGSFRDSDLRERIAEARKAPWVIDGERKPGSARGRIRISDDFDAPLEDFAEYTR